MTLAALLASLLHPSHADVLRLREHAPLVYATATAHGIDPVLAGLVWWRESRWRQSARSRRGAVGFAQVMSVHNERICINLRLDVLASNVKCGARVLRECLRRCSTTLEALGKYHTGTCRADNYARGILRWYERRLTT